MAGMPVRICLAVSIRVYRLRQVYTDARVHCLLAMLDERYPRIFAADHRFPGGYALHIYINSGKNNDNNNNTKFIVNMQHAYTTCMTMSNFESASLSAR